MLYAMRHIHHTQWQTREKEQDVSPPMQLPSLLQHAAALNRRPFGFVVRCPVITGFDLSRVVGVLFDSNYRIVRSTRILRSASSSPAGHSSVRSVVCHSGICQWGVTIASRMVYRKG